jgi:mono/diheme cytochrome c family protein
VRARLRSPARRRSRPRGGRQWRSVGFALAALVLAIAGPAGAQEATPDPVGLKPDHPGYALYQRYCAECHGVRADGRGEKAALFQPPPPELTRLAGRGGVEPRRESLMLVIDGRRTAKGHGERGMPVWGDRLLADAMDSGLVEDARLHFIQSLADYLVSIQRAD